MSFTSRLPYRIRETILPDGERRAYLESELGLADDYSALFIISTARNRGQSVAAQLARLNAINVLYGFCQEQNVDLMRRFRNCNFFAQHECDALGDYLWHDFGPEAQKLRKVVSLGKGRRGFRYVKPSVKKNTYKARLLYVAEYLGWLAKYLNEDVSLELLKRVEEMQSDLRAKKPLGHTPRDGLDRPRLTQVHNELVNKLIAPGSTVNPFSENVQLRNLLLVEVLRQCGMRRGEELNLFVRDVDHVNNIIKVRRRHDSPDDPRIQQPNPKTLERDIPITHDLIQLVLAYVAQRRKIPGAKKHLYLFVTHKAGPTQGQPMTKAAHTEVFKTLAAADPMLHGLTPHQFRHFFSSELAAVQHAQASDQNAQETHRRVRNFIAGRKATSEVDSVYVEETTKQQARQVMKTLHARLPAPVLPRLKQK